jgi:radical SAM enzyme (TIGR01210 family)
MIPGHAFTPAGAGPTGAVEAPVYPASPSARDRFVRTRRAVRPAHDPWRYQGVLVEDERDAAGRIVSVATIFLTGRECPWRCAMCDLWRYTTESDTPPGALPLQVAEALAAARADADPKVAKLYNAGSFFDPRAVPERDYDGIASALTGIEHVIVECHPALVNDRVDRWIAALAGRAGCASTGLEVAMGLETAHPEALARLNKRMTLEAFDRATASLIRRGVAVRAFLLVHPPFVPVAQLDAWLERSVDHAFAAGATAVSLIPLRDGNGTVEALVAEGVCALPTLADVERAYALALAHARGRVFADVWDLERLASCRNCFEPRRARLAAMNLRQEALPPVTCGSCGGAA